MPSVLPIIVPVKLRTRRAVQRKNRILERASYPGVGKRRSNSAEEENCVSMRNKTSDKNVLTSLHFDAGGNISKMAGWCNGETLQVLVGAVRGEDAAGAARSNLLRDRLVVARLG